VATAAMSSLREGLSLPILALRVLSPSLLLLTTLSILPTKPAPPSTQTDITPVVVATHVPRRAVILATLSLAALTYFLDGFSLVVYAVLEKSWPSKTGIDVNAIIGLAGFAGLAALGSWKDIHGVDVWFMKRFKWSIFISLGLDIALVTLLGLVLQHDTINAPHIPERSIVLRDLIHFALPAFRVLLLIPLLGSLLYPRRVYRAVALQADVVPTASSILIRSEQGNLTSGLAPPDSVDSSKYGTFRPIRSYLQRSTPTTRPATPVPSTAPEQKNESKEINPEFSWSDMWKRLRRLSPYLWPKKSRSLQLLGALSVVILLLGRVVNFCMPLTLGQLVRVLEGHAGGSPWPWLFAYVGLRYLQGSGGLSAIRDCLWAPVMQYSDREMSQLSFDHLLNLSFAWHTHRKTGEVLRVLDRGAAINRTLELILFNIVPTFVDIIVALIAFSVFFEWTLTLVIFFVMFAYVTASVVLTRWRTRIRRQMNERDIVTRGIHTDCLLNYETVKYFNGEEYEGARYRDAIREYQFFEYKVIVALNMLNLVQNFIITIGLLIGSMIVAYRVTQGRSDASDFVVFITYLAQLYTPLNQLGYTYRSVNTALIDTEKLLLLLNQPTEVNDKPNAPDLVITDGEIEFNNVSFSYDGRTTALNGVSFKVPKGSSVALVGESGSGKSTILRLLYRFYDLGESEGRILIDGQDIREVTQRSLRQTIGVVPQDPVLFNASIAYNIGYGKFGASVHEIEAAAGSAQMHERILSFPDGYETTVGERGIRLSGGEKQRVAIARTLLKNPPILLLDEATSALDTSTEKDIQKALQNLVQGRSSLSIAHRLSTIASADLILVLKDGQITEQGTHKELLARDDVFAAMWADQISSNEDAGIPLGGDSSKEIAGYRVDNEEGESGDTDNGEASTQPAPDPQESGKEQVAFPSFNEAEVAGAAESTEPAQTFPTSSVVAEPVGFPSSNDDQQANNSPPSSVPTPAVTFDANLNSPPRTGTPDGESEPKKKRMSTQNFQRLARRISITARRQSSSLIPGLKKDSSPRVSVDEGRPDSPAGSMKADDKSKSKKKDKKESKPSA
jgi:ATP-binding cassette subfamily B (MDR/TAP) protein 6